MHNLWVSFDFICNGESQTSALELKQRCFTNIEEQRHRVIAGQELNGVFINAASGFNQNSWKRKRVATTGSGFEGSTMRLIFQWFNDGSNGNNHLPPLTILNSIPVASHYNSSSFAKCHQYPFDMEYGSRCQRL
jgi:hypothetical protein